VLHTDFTDREWEQIRKYAVNVPQTGIVVEIGTGLGGTAWLLKSTSNATVYTIDPYPYSGIDDVLTSLGVNFLGIDSQTAANEWNNGTIDLLFVDGGHDFKSIITDIDVWIPHLSEEGIVIFDDYETSIRGDIANLAVTICLDALLANGMLTQIERFHKVLVAKVNRRLSLSDVDACYQHYMRVKMEDDITIRSKYQKAGSLLAEQFWYLNNIAEDPGEFRKWAETYNMLQATRWNNDYFKNYPYLKYDKIEWLSREIAIEQVGLNILRHGLTDVIMEERDNESSNGM